MKKFINKAEDIVAEMCQGIEMAHPDVEFLKRGRIIKRREKNPEKVTLISGGGSGHEPAHAGYVGKGMLDAAVCGDIFASPSQIQVYQAIRETAGSKGCLLIIKNYSGDMMNFQNAAYLAGEDGIEVDYVKVDDDIAVENSLYTVGHRGVAGTVFVHKIAGAAAEAGKSLREVKAVAEKTVSHVRSIGVAFSSCTVPAKGTPTFELSEDEMEYGVGIHGEPGVRREKMISANELAERMVDALQKALHLEKGSGQETAVMINGFGATPLQELYVLNSAVIREMSRRGIRASRIFVGNYMTSIDMNGASVTILKLDEELKEYLTAPSEASAFPVTGREQDVSWNGEEEGSTADKEDAGEERRSGTPVIRGEKISLDNVIYLVDRMSQVIIENEVPFCELDSHAGDGDFGMSLAKGFRQLNWEWNRVTLCGGKTIGEFLEECAFILMESCGGASGPIWGAAFRAAGKSAGKRTELTAMDFADLMQAAVKGIQDVGRRSFGRGAVVGDKTLIDALAPCADVWSRMAAAGNTLKGIFEEAARAAVKGAADTEKIAARMGRAGTVGERSIGYPDAGAFGVGVILTELNRRIEFR